MVEKKRFRLRGQSWSFGTLVGGVVLGLLIGASGGAATMALVADDGRDGPGQGNAFGQDKDEKDRGEDNGKKDKDKKDRDKPDRPGNGKANGLEKGNRAGGNGHGIEQGLAHGNGPNGDGPPGLLKKR